MKHGQDRLGTLSGKKGDGVSGGYIRVFMFGKKVHRRQSVKQDSQAPQIDRQPVGKILGCRRCSVQMRKNIHLGRRQKNPAFHELPGKFQDDFRSVVDLHGQCTFIIIFS